MPVINAFVMSILRLVALAVPWPKGRSASRERKRWSSRIPACAKRSHRGWMISIFHWKNEHGESCTHYRHHGTGRFLSQRAAFGEGLHHSRGRAPHEQFAAIAHRASAARRKDLR